MTIRYLSFDMDGCLFNAKFNINKELLPLHQSLWQSLHEENKQFERIFVALGSNRQSKESDDANAYKICKTHYLI